jgi:mono/diheme cytochrome c family protein
MRIMALWVSESLYKAGDKSFAHEYLRLMEDKDTQVKMRALMTGRLLKIPGTHDKVKKVMASDTTAGIQLVGKQVLEPRVVTAFFGRSNPNFSETEQAMVNEGAKIFSSLCATCHGPLGTGTPAGPGKLLAPSLVGSSRVQAHSDYVIKTLLHGLTGDIQGESYAGIMMAPMKSNKDEWIASVASFIRTNFENESSLVTAEDVARIRKETSQQKSPYKFDELWASIPKVLEVDQQWKITASHTGEVRKGSTASPRGAFNFEGWTTGVSQQQGMWFQVELPKPATISEIQFRSPQINRGFRGQGPPPLQTYPRGYDLEVSMDGQQWSKIISNGEGTRSSMAIRFTPVQAKFIRMTLTKSESAVHGERRGQPFIYEVAWTMRELKVFGLL